MQTGTIIGIALAPILAPVVRWVFKKWIFGPANRYLYRRLPDGKLRRALFHRIT